MGALTIKPYAFTYRPWEIEKIPVANIFSNFPEIIFLHFKNQKVMRVTSASNSEFITNALRFSTSTINKTFFPKNKQNFAFSTILTNISIKFILLLASMSINHLAYILIFFENYNYKNKFRLNYMLPSLQYDTVPKQLNNFCSKTYCHFLNLSHFDMKSANNIVNLNTNFSSIFESSQSDLYLTTNINLREKALDFYLSLINVNLKSNNLYVFYISKFKNIMVTRQHNIFEYQVSNTISNKNLYFLVHRSINFSIFHLFISNDTSPVFFSFSLKNPLISTTRWLCLGNVNVLGLKNNKKVNSNVTIYDFSSVSNNKIFGVFLNVFAKIIQVPELSAF